MVQWVWTVSEPIDTRAQRLADLKDDMTRKRQIADAAEKRYREEERELWIDLKEEHGNVKTVSVDLPDGGTLQLQRRRTVTASILNKEEAVKALRAKGHGDELLGGPEIRKKILNELVRDLLEANQELPDGVDFNEKKYITITKRGVK